MILDKIVKFKEEEVKEQKEAEPLTALKAKIADLADSSSGLFKQNLARDGVSIIAEVKKASPSKGIIKVDFDPVEIAKQYQAGGASAVSVLTDQEFFQGSINYLPLLKGIINLPLLRKEFIIDQYQLYQSKAYGADAVLLIVAVLEDKTAQFLKLAKQLGLDALVEVHNQAELELALKAGAEIIGINNRNLKDFTVDIDNSLNLSRQIPEDKVIVAESGIKDKTDIDYLKDSVDAFLIGESLMRSASIEAKLSELIE